MQLLTDDVFALLSQIRFLRGKDVWHVLVRLVGKRKARHRLLRGLATHLHTETKISSLEQLVVIGPSLRSSGDARKPPPVKLSGKAGKLGLLKILWQDFQGKLFLFINEESLSVWQPRDNIRDFFFS